MALDAATMALCAAELDKTLAGARIDKIFQPARDEVLLHLRTREASFRLLLAARTGAARVCLTDEPYENPAVPPSFCMLLRKHLSGGRLLAVHTEPGERIVFFDFQCTNEMGDLVQNTLAAELMGRYCNIVLVRRGEAGQSANEAANGGAKILDAMKRVDFEDSDVRQLLPGLPYTMPPRRGLPDFFALEEADVRAALHGANTPEDAVKALAGGIGPVVVREVLFRALGAGGVPKAGEATAAGHGDPAFDEAGTAARLWGAAQSIRRDYESGGVPCLVRGPDGEPLEFSFTMLTQYLPGCGLRQYGSFSEMLESYYAEKDRATRLRQKSRELRKTAQNLYDRAVRKQAARMQELADSEKSDGLRVMGELLTANLHAFQKGDRAVTVQNWYDGTEMAIPLDARLAPAANAQKYFRDYKKRQTAAKMLEKLLAEGAHEETYLQSVLYEIDAAGGEAEFDSIRAELKGAGYLKYYRQRDKKQKPLPFYRYVSADGFVIMAGRNNEQNERLSLKMARGKDLWFHVKNAPGAHVVVMSEGRDIPLATQNEAAMLAAWHSGQRHSAKVPVDYTEVRHLRKTGDLPPGMVLYEHYETAYITPEEDAVRRLEATAEPGERDGKTSR